jgi:hypothetical protein
MIPTFINLLFKWLFSKGCSFYVFFNQTVRVGSNFAKIEKSKIKNFRNPEQNTVYIKFAKNNVREIDWNYLILAINKRLFTMKVENHNTTKLFISLKINLFSLWYSWKIVVNNNYSLIPKMMLKTYSVSSINIYKKKKTLSLMRLRYLRLNFISECLMSLFEWLMVKLKS